MEATKSRLLLLVAVTVIAAAVAGASYGTPVHQQERTITIEAIGPRVPVEELRTEADLVVVARAMEQTARWNSADNQPWTPAEAEPNEPLIYTQTKLAVVGVLKGDTGGGEIEVWTVGGALEGTTVRVGNAPDLRIGEEYLLMLDQVEIPMRDGTESAWLPLSLGQGIFTSTADGYENWLGERAFEASFGH